MDELAHRSMASAQERHWWFAGRRHLLDKLLIRRFGGRRDLRILEVGAGTGSNIRTLTRFGTVTAVEPAPFAADFLVTQHPQIRVLQEAWPVASRDLGAFDVILLLDVLEHLDDDIEGLRAVHAHLAPGGVVVVSVPAYMSMWSEHDEALWHRRRYRRRQLVEVAQGAGLRVGFVSGFNAALLPAAWLARRIGLPGGTGDAMPHPALNSLFAAILRAEASLLGRGHTLPFGLSVVALCDREPAPSPSHGEDAAGQPTSSEPPGRGQQQNEQ